MLLAQLSDLHLCQKPLQGTVYTGGFLKRAIASVLAFAPRPDAVVLTGDLVSDRKPQPDALFFSCKKRVENFG